jgi:hypothetical protein
MSAHKFAAGDRVTYIPGSLDNNVRRGTYTVVRPLPIAGQGNQYRVKHLQDAHERIINEAQLTHASKA